MANFDSSQTSTDDRVAQAHGLISTATRNYYIQAFADAVDDISCACQILSEVYGPASDQLAKPYLLYGKCLIALAKEENNVMEIPTEKEDEDEESSDTNEGTSDNGPLAEGKFTDQPGTSTGITDARNEDADTREGDVGDDEEDDDEVANLQVAWEVLELAANIFSGIPENKKELAECYIELAGISFENSNFEAAIKDFNQGIAVLKDLPQRNNRELAEIYYKIGLANTMLNLFEEAKSSLLEACHYLDSEISTASEELKTDLQTVKAEIENKITEVDEYKQQSMDNIKKEMIKFVSHRDQFDASAGEGCSSKPAKDISHLIKRKHVNGHEGVADSNAGEKDIALI